MTNIQKRRMAMMGAVAKQPVYPIPEGYELVKYLESNGNAASMMNVYFEFTSSKKLYFNAKAAYTDPTKNVGCARTYAASTRYGFEMGANSLRIYGSLQTDFSLEIDNSMHNIMHDKNGDVYLDDTYVGNHPNMYDKSSMYIGLLSYVNQSSIYSNYTGKVALFEAFEDDIMRAQIIPLIRISDNKPFFYNTVTEEFASNLKTGEFGYEKLDGTYVAPR